jgi:dienelactone hydrolase
MRTTLDHAIERPVQIPLLRLAGDLVIPENTQGLIIFAHGSGSSRHSSRNRYVARRLNAGGLATLLLDLLTEAEEQVDLRTGHLRFDIDLLAWRLEMAVEWSAQQPELRDLRVGYFGASTGGGAALVAAAMQPERIGAVVSRGGRPDLAGPALPRVVAPTLLIGISTTDIRSNTIEEAADVIISVRRSQRGGPRVDAETHRV